MDPTFAFYFLLPVIFGVVISVMGVVFLFIDSRRKKESGQIEIEDWDTTGGKIIATRINEVEVPKDNTSGVIINHNFEPIIEYVYTVKDAEYHGNRLFPGDHIYFSEPIALRILKDHPLNMYVPVKYNPDNPSESSLEKRPEGTNYIYLIGLIGTSFGVLVCCFTTVMIFLIMGKYK